MALGFIIRGDDGEDYGPVDLKELRDWVRENRAGLGTTVRTDEPGSLWQPWQYYPELVALLAESKATSPMAGSVLAPLGRRLLAFIVDLILSYILLCPILWVIYLNSPPEITAQLAASFSQSGYTPPQLPPFYEALLQVLFYGAVTLYMAGFHAAHGRTPAKSILRLQVVNQYGQKPGLAQAFMRALVLSFSLFLFFFPLLYVFFNPQRRALHDLVAGTYVVEA